MGENRDEQREKEDSFRFDQVDEIKDLERERGIGPNLAKSNRQDLENPDSAGFFETQGGNKGGLGSSLHLGEEIRKDGGTGVTTYEVAYNSYAQPLRMTYRAMGRLKDLSMTNAPLTPEEAEKDPKLMARFKNLRGSDTSSLTSWSVEQTNMMTSIKRFSAGQHLLAGAMANYSRVQKGLEAKKKEALKHNKLAEIGEVDKAVQTIHKIIDVTTNAWTLAGSLDNIIGGASLDEHAAYADGDVDLDKKKSKSTGTNWKDGTESDPAGERADTSADYGTKKQKIGGAVDTLTGGTAEAQRIVTEMKAKIDAGGDFQLDLDGVLTAVIGGENYVKLKKEVAVLDAQIRKLGLEQEADDMTSATESLNGFRIGFSADKQQIRSDRRNARAHAKDFGNALNGGEHSVMVMYAAEAYQELAAFGRLANQQRQDLMPLWSKASGYIKNTPKERFVALNMVSDGRELAENLGDVIEQRNYFNKHLPQWTATAAKWSAFFGKHADLDLVRKDNRADRAGD